LKKYDLQESYNNCKIKLKIYFVNLRGAPEGNLIGAPEGNLRGATEGNLRGAPEGNLRGPWLSINVDP